VNSSAKVIGRLCPILLLLAFSRHASAQNALPALASNDDAKTLRDAGVETDSAGLLAFFRLRTPTPADRARLVRCVAELGSDEFAVREHASRELAAAGRYALPLLRLALKSTDPEVARRAERCVEQIEYAPTTSLMIAAARLITRARPDGASLALLAILPALDDETSEDAVIQALLAISLNDDVADPVIVAAVNDEQPLRRAAAGYILGQCKLDQRMEAIRLLADRNPRVRFESAAGLLRGGERAAVPALIALVEEGSPALAWRSESLLGKLIGGSTLPPSVGSDKVARQRARSEWEVWWKANADRIDVKRAIRAEVDLGLNLIVELEGVGRGSKGRVWECAADGKPRWQINDLDRPVDAQLLPNGHVLIAEHSPPRVSERLRDGTIVWEYSPPGQPVTCQRIPNGNTFIAAGNQLIEVTREKAVVSTLESTADMVFCARKLSNGHTIYVGNNNQAVEIDGAGHELSSFKIENSGSWASIELLPNGHFLLALFSGRKVVEISRKGEITWQCTIDTPSHATRLHNGNTLVTSVEGRRVAEFDQSGKQIWHQAIAGRPFHASRR
jgi:HEAT repeat protein